MIKIFVWAPTADTVGHAACDIRAGESRNVYVSWWPLRDGEVMCNDRAQLNRTFADDRRDEGRSPSFTIELSGGFEDSAIRWWQERFLRHSPRWCLYGNNCSWVVAQVLRIAFPSGVLDGGDAWNSIWKPMDIARYAWTIQGRLRAGAALQQPAGRAPTMRR